MHSTYSKSTYRAGRGPHSISGRGPHSISGHSEIISMSGLDVAVRPILDLNTLL